MRKLPFLEIELDEIVYLFQGGGALGAFQVGVYQALEEAAYTPDWMVGISIGAINASIIAGNPPKKRLETLQKFWDVITHNINPLGNLGQYAGDFDQSQILSTYNMFSAFYALCYGQSNFFRPSMMNPWVMAKTTPDQLSYYDTTPLRKTLQEVIDFEYLNSKHTSKHTRLSLGAVNIETGKLQFFDTKYETITVDHIMASCALPPGFPAIKINETYYWDGGLYSNTPLICVINDLPHKNRLCFVVDLFESEGHIPNTMNDVLKRSKEINYSGHLDILLDHFDLQLFFQKKIANCISNLPEKLKHDPNIKELMKYGDAHNVHIAKISYPSKMEELHSKGYEFSSFTANKRIKDGYAYTKALLSNANWWKDPEENLGTLVHTKPEDVHFVIEPDKQ